jgi:hypothetical protein
MPPDTADWDPTTQLNFREPLKDSLSMVYKPILATKASFESAWRSLYHIIHIRDHFNVLRTFWKRFNYFLDILAIYYHFLDCQNRRSHYWTNHLSRELHIKFPNNYSIYFNIEYSLFWRMRRQVFRQFISDFCWFSRFRGYRVTQSAVFGKCAYRTGACFSFNSIGRPLLERISASWTNPQIERTTHEWRCRVPAWNVDESTVLLRTSFTWE